MKTTERIAAALIVITCVAGGCADDTPGADAAPRGDATIPLVDAAASPDAQAPDALAPDARVGDSGGSDDGGAGATFALNAIDFVTRKPLAGVKLCVRGESLPCATTNSAGNGSVKGVPNKNVAFTFGKAGYATMNKLRGKDSTGRGFSVGMLTDAAAAGFAALVGQRLDKGKGILIVTTRGPTGKLQSGVSIKLAKSAGAGPFYLDDKGFPSKTLKATSALGQVSIINLPVGDHEVTASHATLSSCTVSEGWAKPGAPATSRFPSIADEGTLIAFTCK